MRYRLLLPRAVRILWVLARYGLDEVLFLIPYIAPLRPLRALLPWAWLPRRQPIGVRLRLAFEALGPVFIKFGQALATRRDVLPLHIADELAKLQDRVPPFSGAVAQRMIETAYGAPVQRIFAQFDINPMSAASVAQVHAARLKDGQEVVVKVLRPDVEAIVRRDLRLMFVGAWLIERLVPDGHRLRPVEVVADYEKTITAELDLIREAANASQTRRNFARNPILYVPRVYWELTRRNVMVMERIYGIPISDIATLKARGVNMRVLAERGVEIFFTQVFDHNFFHADMHAGNIFVNAQNPERPTYLAVDFGICGSLARDDQQHIAHSIYAFFNGDYRRVAEVQLESGWVAPNTRLDELEAVIRALCEPILFRPFKDIHLDQLLLRLFDMARQFDMQVQPQLVLLQKTLVQIEGLGRELYPDLDLWSTAKPFMERWMHRQLGIRGIAARLQENLPGLIETLPALPMTLDRSLKAIEDSRRDLDHINREIMRLQRRTGRARRRTILAISGLALIGGAMSTSFFPGGWSHLLSQLSPGAWLVGLLGGTLILLSLRTP